jgi:aryl-alcohol dehydrogenase-like predicted oxidoreductase
MDKEKSFELLDAYFDAGGNFIDTANNYQDEESERWIGEWITARQNRDRLVLATKYTTDYKSHEHGKGKVVNFCGNHKKSLHMSLRDSLDKLQTDYIDILYLHWWDWTTSIEEVILDQKELDFAILGRICTFETCCRSSYGSSANVLFWNKVQGAFCLIASFV